MPTEQPLADGCRSPGRGPQRSTGACTYLEGFAMSTVLPPAGLIQT